MKNKFKWGGLIALIGFLGLTGTASATPLLFDTGPSGGTATVSYCGLFQLNCGTLSTSGTLYVESSDWGPFTGAFAGNLVVRASGFLEGDVKNTSTWSFTSGGNSLFGTLSGDLAGLLGGIGGGVLDYVVNGGTGLFAGATGDGSSNYWFIGDRYYEYGLLNVAAVPEPALSTLLLAGFGMVAFLAYRRRRVTTQL
jgi:PEP-CTERM motif